MWTSNQEVLGSTRFSWEYSDFFFRAVCVIDWKKKIIFLKYHLYKNRFPQYIAPISTAV